MSKSTSDYDKQFNMNPECIRKDSKYEESPENSTIFSEFKQQYDDLRIKYEKIRKEFDDLNREKKKLEIKFLNSNPEYYEKEIKRLR